ncbi:MAG: hypothetical protein K2Q20_12470 [Phycisphaerales bacterium]|nr:hypothetical protein [Phycisphaerales bacterium]
MFAATQAMSALRSMRRTTLFFAVVLLCGVVNFVPYYAPPNFRYNGADPSYRVWNFGFPFANAIYDDRNGLHDGPLAILLLPMQCLGLLVYGTLAVGLDLRAHYARTRSA